jgi:hypothetical protein
MFVFERRPLIAGAFILPRLCSGRMQVELSVLNDIENATLHASSWSHPVI